MNSVEELLQRLGATKGDARAQAAVAAEFLLLTYPESEREPMRAVMDAAAVLRWFDVHSLAALLDRSEVEAQSKLEALKQLPFIERFAVSVKELSAVQTMTRLGWRKLLDQRNDIWFRTLSARAASYFRSDPTPAGRIEWIYHLLCAAPDTAAADLECLQRDWSDASRQVDRDALVVALKELEETGLVRGRAHVRLLLTIVSARANKGELPQLGEAARSTLDFARTAKDARLEADAECLLGDVLAAQGKLLEAQTAYEKYLSISRGLAEHNPRNAGWLRDLAAAHSRVGDVLQAQGMLAEAEVAYREYLAGSRGIAELDRSNPLWQRSLAIAHSTIADLLQSQGKLPEALKSFEDSLEIHRRLTQLDPKNSGWLRDVAMAHSRVGDVLRAQGKQSEGLAAFRESLTIFRQLSEQDPTNPGWQRELAVAHGRVGESLQAQGGLVEAQVAIGENVRITRRLAEQDPSNAGLQRELAVSNSMLGDVLTSLGKPIAA
jgi:tetratricopeptide (TPR) repeat protein